MNARFLLYVDLLGFSDLVGKDPDIVPTLFHVLDRIQAHKHGSFDVIQFSDTLLVFNNHEPRSNHDEHYFTMYLCEFAQELQYMLLSRDVYLRGLVTRGQFEDTGAVPNRIHKHIRSFWGEALIHAHRITNSIKAIGVFVDDRVKPHMRVFDMQSYDDERQVWFVDTTSLSKQFFNHLTNQRELSMVLDGVRLQGMEDILSYDLLLLRSLFEHSHDVNLSPSVRTKYLTTWDMYRRKYRVLCQAMEEIGFDFSKFLGHDWEPMITRIVQQRGLFG